MAAIKVAFLDTGLDYMHPHIRKFKHLKCLGVNELHEVVEDKERDVGKHGTHTIGIFIRSLEKYCPCSEDDFEIISIRVSESSNKQGRMHPKDLEAGLQWCLDNDVDIVSMSLGSFVIDETFEGQRLTIDKLISRGSLVITAAANFDILTQYMVIYGYMPHKNYPGDYDPCVTVGACYQNGEMWEVSQKTPSLDILALGTGLLSSMPGELMEIKDGTSGAVPFVTYAAFLTLCYLPGTRQNTFKSYIKSTAKEIKGYKILHLNNLLKFLDTERSKLFSDYASLFTFPPFTPFTPISPFTSFSTPLFLPPLFLPPFSTPLFLPPFSSPSFSQNKDNINNIKGIKKIPKFPVKSLNTNGYEFPDKLLPSTSSPSSSLSFNKKRPYKPWRITPE